MTNNDNECVPLIAALEQYFQSRQETKIKFIFVSYIVQVRNLLEILLLFLNKIIFNLHLIRDVKAHTARKNMLLSYFFSTTKHCKHTMS